MLNKLEYHFRADGFLSSFPGPCSFHRLFIYGRYDNILRDDSILQSKRNKLSLHLHLSLIYIVMKRKIPYLKNKNNSKKELRHPDQKIPITKQPGNYTKRS